MGTGVFFDGVLNSLGLWISAWDELDGLGLWMSVSDDSFDTFWIWISDIVWCDWDLIVTSSVSPVRSMTSSVSLISQLIISSCDLETKKNEFFEFSY